MRLTCRPGAGPRLASLVLVSIAAAIAAPVSAQNAPRPAAAVPERSEVQWLQAMQSAAQRLSYSGTIVYQRGGAMQTSRITHYFDGAVSHERLQLLDGKRREYVRRDADVQCLYPDRRHVRWERRLEQDSFPALGGATPPEILERYRLVLGGIERVANTDCRVILLEPRDSLRYGHWLCAEPHSALLLKTQMLDERSEPLEQMAFAELKIGERIDRSQLRPSWSTDGWTVEKVEPQPADVERSGWQITSPPGFRRLRAVMRSMNPGLPDRPAMQVVYSDGLATLSVFIEPVTGNVPVYDEVRRQGPVSAYARRVEDTLVTVLGEVPPSAVRAVAQSVTRTGAPAR
jgi:sigma-E factor negative regulatory protein RseB